VEPAGDVAARRRGFWRRADDDRYFCNHPLRQYSTAARIAAVDRSFVRRQRPDSRCPGLQPWPVRRPDQRHAHALCAELAGNKQGRRRLPLGRSIRHRDTKEAGRAAPCCPDRRNGKIVVITNRRFAEILWTRPEGSILTPKKLFARLVVQRGMIQKCK